MPDSHVDRPHPTRRQVLHGLTAGAVGLALAGRTPAASAAPIASEAPAAAVARPTRTPYVRYEDLYRPGRSLQVIQAVPQGKILTFPEGEFTFRDFASPFGYYDGIRITPNCRGIVGSGRSTVFKMVPNSSTKARVVPRQQQGGTNECALMHIANVDNAVLMNFSLLGTPQGHFYKGLKIASGANAVVDGLYLRGANPGDRNTPPGETFGLAFYRTSGSILRNTEIDGRDPSGVRVSASPLGWTRCRDITISKVYAHHSRAATVTFYECVNVTTIDLRSEYNGSGPGGRSGSGINHENVTGQIRHIRPHLVIDRAGGNTGSHINLQNGKTDVSDIVLTDVVNDAGPGSSGCLSVMIGDSYRDPAERAQKQRTLPKITKNGVRLAPVDAASGTKGAQRDRNFIWYH